MLKATKYLVKTSKLFQNEHIEVQANCLLDNPNTRAYDALANQSNEWKELSNSHSNTGNAEIHSTDPSYSKTS